MMGIKEEQGPKLFYSFNLSKRIPLEHPLCQLKSLLKLDFMYNELKPKYGERGNVSIAPPVLMKMMLLLVLYNVPAERELMRTLPYRLDWLWFLGYDIDEDIPNHSVLSKARKRWGEELFQKLFGEVLNLALESGLIDGTSPPKPKAATESKKKPLVAVRYRKRIRKNAIILWKEALLLV